MERIILWLGIFLVGAMLFACGPKPVTEPVSLEAPKPLSIEVKKEGWEVEWEKTLQAAKKEGEVVIYTTWAPESRKAIGAALQDKYGIEAEFVIGRGAELRARLFNERKAGLYTVDFILMGVSGMIIDLKPAGALDSLAPLLILPEVLDEKAWFGEKLNWSDEQRYVYSFFAFPQGRLAINTTLVKTEEIKSYRDLLLTKWKGKITINDPSTTGSGNLQFTAIDKYFYGLDYWHDFARQEPVLLRDLRLQMEWLARGKYPIAIGYSKDLLGEFIRVGAPISEMMMKENFISQGIGGICLVNRAPHRNAAKVFINWLLGREGQTLASRLTNYQTARIDIPTDFLGPHEVRQEGVKYIDLRNEKFQLEQEEGLKAAKEIFSPLLR